LRSLTLTIVFAALAGAVGCGSPSVDLPVSNDDVTSEAPPSELPAPVVNAVSARYPYAKLALRGSASSAVRILVEGAGNPVAASVQPVDGSFCIQVELPVSPAHYTLTVRSQAGDGRVSVPTTVEVDRANDAPPPTGATNCNGSPAGS
jgi:hypothetical protein